VVKTEDGVAPDDQPVKHEINAHFAQNNVCVGFNTECTSTGESILDYEWRMPKANSLLQLKNFIVARCISEENVAVQRFTLPTKLISGSN